MPELFTPRHLGPNQIDQAYPIVQSIVPGLKVDDWRMFARRVHDLSADVAGIMTVQSKGYIHGLFSYTVEPHLQHRRVLSVNNVVVVDLFDPGAVAEALLEAMEALALDLDCRAIHTMLPNGPHSPPNYRRWLLNQFRVQGHEVESLALCKRFGGEHGGGRIDASTANDNRPSPLDHGRSHG
jgi:hypothetical protein